LRPGARISFLSSEYAAPVLARHPDVDEVLTVSGQERLSELIALFRQEIDAAIFLKHFRRLMTAAWLARVPLRVGTGYRWYSWLLNRRVYEHRRDFSRHESACNLGLLRGLGLAPGDVVPPRLVVTPEEREWARGYLGIHARGCVVVHPGGISSRIWKPAHFRDLILRLAQEGLQVLVTGTRTEAAQFQIEAGVTAWPEGVQDLRGLLTLRQLMAIVAQSRVVVSLVTGPMHLAAALGIPTVSLLDPRRNNSPTRWGPLGRGVMLRPDVPTCEKCIYEACPYWDCLDRITVDAVSDRISQILARDHSIKPVEPVEVVRV